MCKHKYKLKENFDINKLADYEFVKKESVWEWRVAPISNEKEFLSVVIFEESRELSINFLALTQVNYEFFMKYFENEIIPMLVNKEVIQLI